MKVAERARADSFIASPRRIEANDATPPAAAGVEARDTMVLNLFFEDRDDRWLRGDRHLRPLLRRLLLGKPWISGQQRVFLNLCAGLDRLGISYRVNDYRYIQRHPEELACIIGRPFVLDRIPWKNPILLGVASYNHPIDAPDLLQRLPVKAVLVPCDWYAKMCRPGWPSVEAWPVGIDTDAWMSSASADKTIDVLLYDKARGEREALIEPIRAHLAASGRSFQEIRYGGYQENDFRAALACCRAMIFLSEHESQGIACQQALSSGVPVFAWDRGGAWRDPDYYPHRVQFEGVSSVPYWDERCGMKFVDTESFKTGWRQFWARVEAGTFKPRDYILDNLTLEKQALRYYEIAQAVLQRQRR